MWNRKELKQTAKVALKRNYWKAVFVSIVFMSFVGVTGTTANNATNMSDSFSTMLNNPAILIASAVLLIAIIAIGVFLFVLIFNPFEVGYAKFHINAIKDTANVSDLGSGYDVSYKRNVKVVFLRDLYLVLWSMLFVIPGIVKSYEYRMIPYILAENPEITANDAFKMSKEMMKGNKWRAFVLDISFILWGILGAITAGIVTFLYVLPYIQLTHAALYEALKSETNN